MLTGKSITLGITGGIAAYKGADIASRLVKEGAGVKVILTRSARNFIGEATLEAISGGPVYTEMFGGNEGWQIPHIKLAGEADLILVAPATANIIAKAAHGLADDLLSTALLAATCPVVICPAMNVHMYNNKVVQANLSRLEQLGYHLVEPDTGRLACGTQGRGRLPDPAAIVARVAAVIAGGGSRDLAGLTVLVTAGATREAIDPVRYVSNRSSGKMGYAIAAAALSRGARVILISGRTSLSPPQGTLLIQVESAREMYRAVMDHYPTVDVVIKAAAVADYRPVQVAGQKIKKTGSKLTLEMEKNADILLELGQLKQRQILVGFAAETEDLINNAREKVAKKNLDLIVANDVTVTGAGFGSDTNLVKLIYPDGRVIALDMMNKLVLGHRILDQVLVIKESNDAAGK